MHRLFLRHDINLLGMQCLEGWQIVWHFYWHNGSGSWSEVIRATESCQWSQSSKRRLYPIAGIFPDKPAEMHSGTRASDADKDGDEFILFSRF